MHLTKIGGVFEIVKGLKWQNEVNQNEREEKNLKSKTKQKPQSRRSSVTVFNLPSRRDESNKDPNMISPQRFARINRHV